MPTYQIEVPEQVESLVKQFQKDLPKFYKARLDGGLLYYLNRYLSHKKAVDEEELNKAKLSLTHEAKQSQPRGYRDYYKKLGGKSHFLD